MTTRRTIAAGILLVTVAATPLSAEPGKAPAPVEVRASGLPFVRQIDERYQSFQVGFSHLTGGETWRAYDKLDTKPGQPRDFASVREARPPADLTNPKLRNLTRALAPFYVRYSGTTANSVYFHDSDAPLPEKVPDGFTVMLTRKAWKGAIDFARAVDAKIVTSFANSPGVRDSSGAWTPRMAASWLAFTKAAGGEIVAAELYNEPNAPEPPRIPKGHTGAEFARDYAAFSAAVRPLAPSMKLAGPSTATLGIPGVSSISGITAEDYASASPKPRFDVFTFHFYPALAQRCAPENSPQGISADRALTPEWLARPDAELARQMAVRDRHAPGAPIWLTETGGAACGGLRWQQTWLDVFRYLDTHARLAKNGLDAIFTHALISGSNGVIDEKTFEPNASYWGAVLWRRLMGTRVLDAGPQRPGLQLYAHCQRGVRGGVTLLALNIGESGQGLRVPAGTRLYRLTGPEMQGRTVLLNGKELKLAGDALPAMDPVRVTGRTVDLAPASIAFVTLPNARNPACR